jgi:hypothetical protein
MAWTRQITAAITAEFDIKQEMAVEPISNKPTTESSGDGVGVIRELYLGISP